MSFSAFGSTMLNFKIPYYIMCDEVTDFPKYGYKLFS